VADRLLTLIRSPLEKSWGAGSFIVKAPDPGGSGRRLSLCYVGKNGILWTWVDWLDTQLTELWGDERAASRLTAQHVELLSLHIIHKGEHKARRYREDLEAGTFDAYD
jgi:hypothetical protein